MRGRVARLGDRASPGDEITLDGKVLPPSAAPVPRILLYHKPVGELVTRRDPEGRRTVFERRLPPGRWVAVGRLDLNTSGLLLLTNSGELAERLMHPRYGVEREYLVRVQGLLGERELAQLRRGVRVDDANAAFERIEPADPRTRTGANRWYRAVLREGRNREVRKLFAAVGGRVSRLVRLRYGPFELPRTLPPGGWAEVRYDRVQRLFEQ